MNEAIKQAKEALEFVGKTFGQNRDEYIFSQRLAIDKCAAALASLSAQQEQKPFAHVTESKNGAFVALTASGEDLTVGTALHLAAPQASQPTTKQFGGVEWELVYMPEGWTGMIEKLSLAITNPDVKWAKPTAEEVTEFRAKLAAKPIAQSASQPVTLTDEHIKAVADRMWRVHPRELQDAGITRKEFYEREIRALLAAQPDAEAIRREALEEAAQVIELYDDATMAADNHMLDSSECAGIIRALAQAPKG